MGLGLLFLGAAHPFLGRLTLGIDNSSRTLFKKLFDAYQQTGKRPHHKWVVYVRVCDA